MGGEPGRTDEATQPGGNNKEDCEQEKKLQDATMAQEQHNREDRTKKQEQGRRDRENETGKTQWAKATDRITGGDGERIGATQQGGETGRHLK